MKFETKADICFGAIVALVVLLYWALGAFQP